MWRWNVRLGLISANWCHAIAVAKRTLTDKLDSTQAPRPHGSSAGFSGESSNSPHLPSEPPCFFNEAYDTVQTLMPQHVGKYLRALAAHALRVGLHEVEIGSAIGGEVNLVDDEEVGAGDRRPALARHFLPARHIMS